MAWWGNERPVSAVPRPVLLLLAVALILQAAWHLTRPSPTPRAAALPVPPPAQYLRLLSLGDPLPLAKSLMLWLQAFDNPPGISIPFADLDYGRVIQWLRRILALDPRGQYPLLAAARLYADVPSPPRQKQMLAFVYREFLKDPNRRWPWMAHAVFVARHRLHDMKLALKYANALAKFATGPKVPDWAKQMRIFVMADMGDVEAAKVLLGGLLASGEIKDPHELAFLRKRLDEMEAKSRRPGGKAGGQSP
jgi:hypothetical protein